MRKFVGGAGSVGIADKNPKFKFVITNFFEHRIIIFRQEEMFVEKIIVFLYNQLRHYIIP